MNLLVGPKPLRALETVPLRVGRRTVHHCMYGLPHQRGDGTVLRLEALEIRVKFYKAIVVNTLLWGCETWSMTSMHRRRLESCHHNCLRSILRISKIQRIRNSEIRERAGISTMRNMHELRRARYLHKIVWMDAHWCGNQRYVRAISCAHNLETDVFVTIVSARNYCC